MNEAPNAARREWRKKNCPEYYDYRSPRTAQEYLHNNVRRRRAQAERTQADRNLARLAAFAVFVFILALLIG